MFEDEIVGQHSDEVSQKTSVTARGGEDQLDRDLTEQSGHCNMSTPKEGLTLSYSTGRMWDVCPRSSF